MIRKWMGCCPDVAHGPKKLQQPTGHSAAIPIPLHSLTILALSDSTISEVYNVGGVGEISINNLAEKIISTTKSASNIRHIPYDQAYPSGFEDMQRRVPDTSKIQSAVDWKPVKSLEDIIQDVSDYFNSK